MLKSQKAGSNPDKVGMRHSKGFTLMELMVVMGILAVLMSIVLPTLVGVRGQSVEAQVKSDGDAVQKGADRFNNLAIKATWPDQALGTTYAYDATNGTVKLASGWTASFKDKDGSTSVTVLGGASKTATTIAFVDSNPDTITDTGSGFVTAGFKAGDIINVAGSTSNNGNYTIASVAAGTITLIAANVLMAESVGATVTIKAFSYKELKWDATTSVWLNDGSIATRTFIPDFVLKTPDSLTLQNDDGVLSFVGTNKLYEFLWLMKIGAPGTSEESRRLEVYRQTAADSTSTPKIVTYTRIF